MYFERVVLNHLYRNSIPLKAHSNSASDAAIISLRKCTQLEKIVWCSFLSDHHDDGKQRDTWMGRNYFMRCSHVCSQPHHFPTSPQGLTYLSFTQHCRAKTGWHTMSPELKLGPAQTHAGLPPPLGLHCAWACTTAPGPAPRLFVTMCAVGEPVHEK